MPSKISQAELIKRVETNNSKKDSEFIVKAISKLNSLDKELFHSKEKVIENLEIADILADINADPVTIATALICSKRLSKEQIDSIQKEFGEEVAILIKSKIRFEKALKSEKSMKNPNIELRKLLFFSLAKNVKLILLVIADRLSLIRKINRFSKEDRNELALEQKEILIPLAHKLGVINIKSEADDLVFKYQEPKKHAEIEKQIKNIISARRKEIQSITSILSKKSKEKNIKIKTSGRIKSIHSTFYKMQTKNKTIDQIHDIIAIRVICDEIKDCYEMLGIIHSLWRPISEEFDDYITKPKTNNYQSLHTTVLGSDNNFFEIQIRTHEMHKQSEFGVASHWKYKKQNEQKIFDKKISWLNELLSWQKELKKVPTRIAKVDFFGDNIYVLSPKGDTLELPKGSTALDFAYAIHDDLGNKCSVVKVNQKKVPLNHKLETADMVEIETSFSQKPKIQWLNFVVTSKAKKRIEQSLQLSKLKSPSNALVDKNIIRTTDKRIKIARCCLPLPGDEIFGFRTTKRKIAIHRHDCQEILKFPQKAQYPVNWDLRKKLDYSVELQIIGQDRPGLLSDLLNVFTDSHTTVLNAKAKLSKGEDTHCIFKIETKNLQELEKTIEKLRKVEPVKDVKRI